MRSSLVAILSCLLLAPGAAGAARGDTIFQDDFAQRPIPAVDAGQPLPAPEVGTWGGGASALQLPVYDQASENRVRSDRGVIGPAPGSSAYLDVLGNYDHAGSNAHYLYGNFSRAARLGDVVHLSAEIAVGPNHSAGDGIWLGGAHGEEIVELDVGAANSGIPADGINNTDTTGHFYPLGNGLGAIPTSAFPFTVDRWYRLDLTYVLNATSFSVSIDGAPAHRFENGGADELDWVGVGTNGAGHGELFFDALRVTVSRAGAVPEPAALGFAGLLVLALGLRRGRSA